MNTNDELYFAGKLIHVIEYIKCALIGGTNMPTRGRTGITWFLMRGRSGDLLYKNMQDDKSKSSESVREKQKKAARTDTGAGYVLVTGNHPRTACMKVNFAELYKGRNPLAVSQVLLKKIEAARKANCIVQIDLDGTRGYSPSYIRQTFGGLARRLQDMDAMNRNVVFVSEDEPSLPKEISVVMRHELSNAVKK